MPAGHTLDQYCARPSKPHSDAKYLEKGLNGGRGTKTLRINIYLLFQTITDT